MKFISSLDNNAREELYSYGGVYMHGKLQDDIGYDIPILTEGEMQVGVNDCEIQFPDGKIVSARAYIWQTKFKVNPWNVRGLIVYQDDMSSRIYAMNRFLESAENL